MSKIEVEYKDKGEHIPVRVEGEIIITARTMNGKVTLSQRKFKDYRSIGVRV